MALDHDAVRHRPILAEYSPALLDQMIAVVTASTVTAYALYTMSPETMAKFHTQLLPATLLFVLYGIFRYLYLLPAASRGQPVGALARRPGAADQYGLLDLRGSADHLRRAARVNYPIACPA